MDPRINGYQRGLASMVYTFFDKRTKGSGLESGNRFPKSDKKLNENEILAEELHKPVIKNFKRRNVCSSFRDHIWDVDLADISLISEFNKGIKYSLGVIDLFSRYSWVIPLKNKKVDSIVEGFKKILKNSNRKPDKI